MNLKKKLTNPLALVIEGFVLGALLFFATATPDADSPPATPAMRSAAVQENPAA